MLTKIEKIEYHKACDREIEVTIVKLAELVEVTKPIAPENSIGRISRMDAINNKSVNDDALIKARMRLKRLERQRDRVNESTFGLCIKCGIQIPMGRLLYMPETTVCVQCAP